MKNPWTIRGHLIIRYPFGHVHMLDWDKPSRLMWITARSARHAARLEKILHWQQQRRPDFWRQTYYDPKAKQLVSSVCSSQ